jgi:hypothetical protein
VSRLTTSISTAEKTKGTAEEMRDDASDTLAVKKPERVKLEKDFSARVALR